MTQMTQDIMQMIDSLSQMKYRQKARKTAGEKKIVTALSMNCRTPPARNLLNFSRPPYCLKRKRRDCSGQSCKVNRHSPLFTHLSGQMEEIVSRPGSICITKAVPEQQGETFSMIDHLTIVRLRE